MESYEKIKKVLALGFMNFLDENKPKDKMCLSNGECADIEKAFNEQDWPRLAGYLDKYTESEDERIRKAIVHLLEVASEAYLIEATGFKKEQFLSYLEKQKEHKPVEKQDYSGLNDLERAIHRGFLVAGVENVSVTIIKETAQDCIAHMPAEWSEEDEKIMESLISLIETIGEYYISLETIDRYVAWLKSLRPQPKQEWSEGDEKMLKCCFIAINHYEKTCNIGDHLPTKFNIDGYLTSVDKVKSWLKSLRPSWKPSEEQMEALEELIDDANRAGWVTPGATELYEQLKKL